MTQAITIAENKKNIVNIVQEEKFKSQLAAALMARIPEEYVIRSAIATINNDSKLHDCEPYSVAASVLLLAQAGLAPEPWKGHGYLIPRNKRVSAKGEPYRAIKVCTALIGYRGYVHLAYRSKKVIKAAAYPVYEGDIFDIDLASGLMPIHKPWVRPEEGREKRGALLGAYAFIKMSNGECLPDWMPKEDIDAVRSRSTSKDDGPWVTDYSEMARKTPFRRLFKWIPDEELQAIASLDEANEQGRLEATYDADTGEITTRMIESEPQEERKAIAMPQKVQESDSEAEETPEDGEIIEGKAITPAQGSEALKELFASGAVKKGSDIEAPKPGTIGVGRAKRLYTILNRHSKETGWTEEKFKTEFFAPLKIEHARDVPVDTYDRLCKLASGELKFEA